MFSTATDEANRLWEFFVDRPPLDNRNLITSTIRDLPEGSVFPVKSDVHSPDVMSSHVKEFAWFLGATAVGITRLIRPPVAYSESQIANQTTPHYAIVTAVITHHDVRSANGIGGHAPDLKGLFVTRCLSAYIRELGYNATAQLSKDYQGVAVTTHLCRRPHWGWSAIARHRLQLADVIVTDLPLAEDGVEVVP